MKRAIFITDLPDCCADCHWADIEDNGCYLAESEFSVPKSQLKEERIYFCPLKPLPERCEDCPCCLTAVENIVDFLPKCKLTNRTIESERSDWCPWVTE